ncbi:MAG: ABC transporter ATP-binding protein [Pseudomonadota bacterium]|nr:ABC transporter ATP-binding protein [Pseudomonadota bacterium]
MSNEEGGDRTSRRLGLAAIEVHQVSKRFGEVRAVHGVSFTIERGSICALLGANAAGKTTTLAMLLGLVTPSAGSIRVLGHDLHRNRRFEVLGRMNFSSPYVDLPQRLTVAENLTVYGRLYGVPNLKKRLAELAPRLEIEALMRREYRTLSAGQKTRVVLAKALVNRPEVLLLDEPTASLDPDTADRIRRMLIDYQRETSATLVLASHNMTEVERVCDRVLMMRGGEIVDRGTPAGLIARYGRDTLEEVFLDIARRRSHDGLAATAP